MNKLKKGYAELTEQVHICLRDKDGRIKVDKKVKNTVTTLAKTHVADRMSDQTEAEMGWMGIGTGTPSATALGTQLDRNALTTRTAADNIVTYVGDWAAGDGTGAITEAGIFNASTAGTMLVSASFSAVNKLATDALKVTWTLTVS